MRTGAHLVGHYFLIALTSLERYRRLRPDSKLPNVRSRRKAHKSYKLKYKQMSSMPCIGYACSSTMASLPTWSSMADCYPQRWGPRMTVKGMDSRNRRQNGTEPPTFSRRDEALAKAQALSREGQHALAREHFVKAVDITPQMAYQLIKVHVVLYYATVYAKMRPVVGAQGRKCSIRSRTVRGRCAAGLPRKEGHRRWYHH